MIESKVQKMYRMRNELCLVSDFIITFAIDQATKCETGRGFGTHYSHQVRDKEAPPASHAMASLLCCEPRSFEHSVVERVLAGNWHWREPIVGCLT